MKNKKGVSTFIAVILLILFVITISGVAFNWIKGQTSEVMERGDVLTEKLQACQEIDFSVEDAYCDGDVIKIKMSNNRNIDFKDGFSLRLMYSEDEEGNEVSTFVYGTELKAYESVEINALRQFRETDFGKDYFEVSEIEIVPKLSLGGKVTLCGDNKQILKARDC